MKKILILLSFLSVFGFSDWITEQQFTSSCVAPKVRVEVLPPVIYNQGICSTGGVAALESYINTNTTSYFYNSGVYYYVERSVIYTLSNKACVDETHHKMTCQTNPCPDGKKWNIALQKCELDCLPNEQPDPLIGADEVCIEMCYKHDKYTPTIWGRIMDSFNPYHPSMCTPNPDNPVPDNEDECEATTGYDWSCRDHTSIFDPILEHFGYPTALGCGCYSNNALPVIFANPSSLPGGVPLPRTAPEFIDQPNYPRLGNGTGPIPPDEVPALPPFDPLNDTIRTQLTDNWASWASSDSPNVPRTSSGDVDLFGRNYDYIDTKITKTPDGRFVYEPDFTPSSTSSTNNSITVTSDTFSGRVNSNLDTYTGTVENVPNGLPSGSVVPPEAYITGYQTATRANIEFLFDAETNTYTLVTTRPSTTSTSTSTEMTIPATRTYYNVTDEGYTVAAYEAVNGSTTYYVSVATNPNDNTETTAVSTKTTVPTSSGTFSHNTAYSYTTSLTTGNVVSSVPGSSTITNPGGTTYTNPSTNTNYNYNSTQQNLDEFLNTPLKYTPQISEAVDDFSDFLDGISDYLNNFMDTLNSLGVQFNDLINQLKGLPQVEEKHGSCAVIATFHGWSKSYDWCSIFLPFKPLVSLFLSLTGTFFVVRFAVKNLNK